jgi:hypothetical protein
MYFVMMINKEDDMLLVYFFGHSERMAGMMRK